VYLKANGTREKVKSLVDILNGMGDLPDSVEVCVTPCAVHVDYVEMNLRKDISVGAQNISTDTGYGAFTGELTADMFIDLGCNYVMTGHSERRRRKSTRNLGHDESAGSVAEKTKYALAKGLKVILCIGETLDDRQANKTLEVCRHQLQAVLDAVRDHELWRTSIVIAYEPVWAIGTGVTASPEQAQEVHADIRMWLTSSISAEVASEIRLIYGGSVNGGNAGDLIKCEDVDGFLVGGASLKEDFKKIIAACPVKIDPEEHAKKRQKTTDYIRSLNAVDNA